MWVFWPQEMICCKTKQKKSQVRKVSKKRKPRVSTNASDYDESEDDDGYTSDNSETVSRSNSVINLHQNPTGTAMFGGQSAFVLQAPQKQEYYNSGALSRGGFGVSGMLSDDSHLVDTDRSESAQLSHSDTFKLRGTKRISLLEQSVKSMNKSGDSMTISDD